MSETPRLNGVIRALEEGKPAFVNFSAGEVSAAVAMAGSQYDAVCFEMEHTPFDVGVLRNCLQYMLDRGQIVRSGSLAPGVTPMVRIPVNGIEMNQFIAKQVLDIGVYGVIWPHVSSVEEARNAVASCRYPRPESRANYHPAGMRGDGPRHAARYWGIGQQEYYERADVWPLNPRGEIICGIMCEEIRAIKNLPQMLKEVPGIGVVIIGEGDLSQDMGFPRQYEHPEVAKAIDDILAICKEHNVVCGHPHVDAKNVEGLIEKGFRWLMPAPEQSFKALEIGRKAGGRT